MPTIYLKPVTVEKFSSTFAFVFERNMNFGARRIRRPVVAERSVRLMDRREVIAGADKTNVVYHGNSRGDNFGEEENLAVRKELEARVRATG